MPDDATSDEDVEAQDLLADAVNGETGGGGEEEAFDSERAKAKIAKVNAEAANLRKRLKELEPLAAKAKELEDAGKSETQREREAREAAEKRASDAEQRLLRMEVAQAKGLTAAQAKRLVGTTAEELEADADELLESFGTREAPPVPRRPREALRPGGAPESEPEETDPRKLAALIADRSANR